MKRRIVILIIALLILGFFLLSNPYSKTVAKEMLDMCGYQHDLINYGAAEITDKPGQEECLINNLEGGDTVDDCWISFNSPHHSYNDKNMEIIKCYLTIDYDYNKAIGLR